MSTVSVIVPAYNAEDTIERAVEGVLAQTYPDVDLVVVDDASTDGTRDRVLRYDDRLTYCRHEENRGGSAARNTGLDAADGRYVAFLDDDDVWLPTKLERQVSLLESRPEEWIAAYCGYRAEMRGVARVRRSLSGLFPTFDSAGERSDGRAARREGGEELIPSILTMEFDLGGSSTLLVERRAAEAIGGFEERFPRHQDWEFLVRLLRRGKLTYLDEDLVVKRESGLHDVDDVVEAKRRFFSTFAPEIERAHRQGYDVTGPHRLHLALCHFRAGRFRSGVHHLRRARRPTVPEALHLGWASILGGAGLLRRAIPTERLGTAAGRAWTNRG